MSTAARPPESTITGASWAAALPRARTRRRAMLHRIAAAVNNLQAARFAELQASNARKLDELDARARAREVKGGSS